MDNKIKILIVDDNPLIQHIVSMMLTKLGIRADFAANGQEALCSVENTPYDLVLMDILMPKMDGIEATRFIREKMSSGPKIIIVSDCDPDEYQELCYDAGADDFLAKPVTLMELRAAIGRNLSVILDELEINLPFELPA